MAKVALLLSMLVAQAIGQSCTSNEINKGFDDISRELLRYKYHPDLRRENWQYGGHLRRINCTAAEWKQHILELPTMSRLQRVVTEWTFLTLRQGLSNFKYYLSEWKSEIRKEALRYYNTDIGLVKKALEENMSENWTLPEIVYYIFKAIGEVGYSIERMWQRRGSDVFLGIFHVHTSTIEIFGGALYAYYIFKLSTFGTWFWDM